MFGLFGGFKTIKEIADEIGVEHKVFGTALTEMGVNYAAVKAQKEALLKLHGEYDTHRFLAVSLVPLALDGLAALQAKYGHQERILAAAQTLETYFETNQYILDKIFPEG